MFCCWRLQAGRSCQAKTPLWLTPRTKAHPADRKAGLLRFDEAGGHRRPSFAKTALQFPLAPMTRKWRPILRMSGSLVRWACSFVIRRSATAKSASASQPLACFANWAFHVHSDLVLIPSRSATSLTASPRSTTCATASLVNASVNRLCDDIYASVWFRNHQAMRLTRSPRSWVSVRRRSRLIRTNPAESSRLLST